jgi:pimeloyl-ACP methyl ester carboxylesterase
MAVIVFVHGIDNHRESADLIESTWLPALAGGVRLEGRGDLADRLWPPRSRPNSIDARAAYYGHLFRAMDQQESPDDLSNLPFKQQMVAEALAVDWLGHVAERADDGSDEAVQAQMTLQMASRTGEVQGIGNILREVVRTLSQSSMFAGLGMNVAGHLLPALAQVSRYLTDPSVRNQARRAVLDLVGPETRVIVGHSLGSVVAYECTHRLSHSVPLLVTVGSPLGLRSIVTERLDPTPSFPPKVDVWLNVANREDVIAAEPDLRPLFAADSTAATRFHGSRFEETTKPHRAETYLGRQVVGRAVIEALGS